VNVPADYPFESFESLYFDAWKAGLKGLATYRPNTVLGSVLSVKPDPTPTTTSIPDLDPLKQQFEHRPLGDLESVTSKVQLGTHEGKKTVYLSVSL